MRMCVSELCEKNFARAINSTPEAHHKRPCVHDTTFAFYASKMQSSAPRLPNDDSIDTRRASMALWILYHEAKTFACKDVFAKPSISQFALKRDRATPKGLHSKPFCGYYITAAKAKRLTRLRRIVFARRAGACSRRRL